MPRYSELKNFLKQAMGGVRGWTPTDLAESLSVENWQGPYSDALVQFRHLRKDARVSMCRRILKEIRMERPPIDECGEELIERHFAYRDEWDLSYLLQCPVGHIALCQSRLSNEIPDGKYFGTCTRSDHGGPICGKKMSLYTPDDEGLTAHQWTKRCMRRDSKRIESLSVDNLRLESAIKDIVALFKGPEPPKGILGGLEEIIKRPVVKRALGR